MDLLKEKIKNDGIVINENVLKVDNFLNHQVDTKLMDLIGKEFADYFKEKNITKVVTIESSGIAPAYAAALKLEVPLVIFKKQSSAILDTDTTIQTPVHSFTKNTDYILMASKKYLSENDNVLIIDDFLANGQAALGLVDLVKQTGAHPSGIGIVIEKGFQDGGKMLREKGFHVESLAIVESLDNGQVTFKQEDSQSLWNLSH